LNDIYYNLYQGPDSLFYFSFVNDQGLTILHNDYDGYDSKEKAESVIEEILRFAKNQNHFEVDTALGDKYFFILKNEKGVKIGNSYYFRKEEELKNVLDEFVSGKPSIKQEKDNVYSSLKTKEADIIPISQGVSDERIKKEKEHRQKIWQEEIKIRKAEKEQKAKELELYLADKKEKRKKVNLQKEQEKKLAIMEKAKYPPNHSRDVFDGCFRWLFLLLLLLLLSLFFPYFKGCIGNAIPSDSEITEQDSTVSIDEESEKSTKDLSVVTKEVVTKDKEVKENLKLNKKANKQKEIQAKRQAKDSKTKNRVEIADCNCSKNAIIFEMPESEAKKIKKISKPQFGNIKKLSASDFLEDLKYYYTNSNLDRKYLDYLYKSMGYAGFKDAKASHFSSGKISSGVKGILGYGENGAYVYSQLDLSENDLDVFRVEAANGCHINFLKSGGNVFFTCQ